MAGSMAGLYIGVSGLQGSQTALNTVSHNLSNINTEGYTRQQITYSTAKYFTIGQTAVSTLQYGVGVNVQEIRRVRDEFLDKSYRQENGRASFYEAQYSAVEEVETLFGETEGVKFEDSINNLWSSLNELAANPGSTVTRTELVQNAVAFIDRANAIYDGLVDYQKMLNVKVSDMVDTINGLGEKINSLNKDIMYIEGTGESANDKRDELDSALDELASYVKIDYWEDDAGRVNINIEGCPFLSGKTLFKMGTQEIGQTGLYEPVWPAMGNLRVFDITQTTSTAKNNDIGELKGLILARGSVSTDYRDIPVEPEKPVREDYETDADYDAAQAQYESDLAQYKTDVKYYYDYLDNSVISNTIATFDKLINGIVESINDVLCPETVTQNDIYDGDGNLVVAAGTKVLDMSETSYGMDDNRSVGVELFSRNLTDRYNEISYTDASGKECYVYVRNDTSSAGTESLYTLGNISVNDAVLQDYQVIPLGLEDGSEDFAKAQELLDCWDVKFAALNPDKYAKENFNSFYNSLVSDIANTGQVLYNMQTYQQSMAQELDNKRQETVGVSSDDELTNMIKYQAAYNAASRYITVVSEMMEHLVTSLGS